MASVGHTDGKLPSPDPGVLGAPHAAPQRPAFPQLLCRESVSFKDFQHDAISARVSQGFDPLPKKVASFQGVGLWAGRLLT